MYVNFKLVTGMVTGIIGACIGAKCLFDSDSTHNKSMNQAEPSHNNTKDKQNPNSPKPANTSVERLIHSSVSASEDQGTAAFIEMINAIRLDRLLKRLAEIDKNEAGAADEIQKLKAEVQKLLSSNRGGTKGIHGFIGETAQVHIANIEAYLKGEEPLYFLLNDNSMTDYYRGEQLIQQKCCRSGGKLGLDHILKHKEKYPEFKIKEGLYQIPKDFYERYDKFKNMPEKVAMKLRKEELRLWKVIKQFSDENPDVVVEPMLVTYDDIQAEKIEDTISRVEDDTNKEFVNQKNEAEKIHAPSWDEFVKVCAITAIAEGTVEGVLEGVSKICQGKKLSDFTAEDRKDILRKFAIGGAKGTFRGAIVYLLTNFKHVSAGLASAFVTVLFDIFKEGRRLFKKKISKVEFLKASIIDIIEAVISLGGAYIGKRVCKNSIIGALLGSGMSLLGTGCVRKIAYC